jgi:alcohol dehydrogenase
MKFEYYNLTRLIFGAGSLTRLGEFTLQYGKRALLVTGGGSIKRNGTFDRAVISLSDAGISVFECEAVEPDPRLTSVKRGAEIARTTATWSLPWVVAASWTPPRSWRQRCSTTATPGT